MKYLAVFIIWIIGCFVADNILHIEKTAYAMWWGFTVGYVTLIILDNTK
jgi:hypothetical protein